MGIETIVGLIVFIAVPILGLCIFLAVYIPFDKRRQRKRTFIAEHSRAYKDLLRINKEYSFKTFNDLTIMNNYDNDKYYGTISTSDYLIYYINYHMSSVQDGIYCAVYNNERLKDYKEDLKTINVFGNYDVDELPDKKEKIDAMEKQMFEKKIFVPKTSFFVTVTLYLTNINGRYITSKRCAYNMQQLKEYISRVKNRHGKFYNDEGIWNALCRVERGKVTNRLRFAVYRRDHNRCRMCGSRYDLEVDHIYPIAKGGKTTFDNLQTLCHRCNQKKGTSVKL